MTTPTIERSPRSRLLWLLALLALVAAACGTSGKETTSDGDGDADDEDVVMLQQVGGPEVDPFTDSVASIEITEFAIDLASHLGGVLDGFEGSVSGDAPGLYGGSGDESVCDLDALADHLLDEDNADKAEAFADVMNIGVDHLEDFLDELTPVVLTTDTLVMNHGFKDGRANGFPAVLQAGTAVAVDANGLPRVKCGCGNPLAEVPNGFTMDEDTPTAGEPWAGWNVTNVWIIISSEQTINEFTFIDVETGDTYVYDGDGCYWDNAGNLIAGDCATDEGPDDDDHGGDAGSSGVGEVPDDDHGGDAGSSGVGEVPEGEGLGGPDCTGERDTPFCGTPLDDMGLEPSQYVEYHDWSADAVGLGRMGSFRANCPAGGTIGVVYGGGGEPYVYGDRSSVCSAAVHAGFLDAANGGVVFGHRWSINPGEGLPGKEANGILSRNDPDVEPTSVFIFR